MEEWSRGRSRHPDGSAEPRELCHTPPCWASQRPTQARRKDTAGPEGGETTRWTREARGRRWRRDLRTAAALQGGRRWWRDPGALTFRSPQSSSTSSDCSRAALSCPISLELSPCRGAWAQAFR
jgi:hypothetical protein